MKKIFSTMKSFNWISVGAILGALAVAMGAFGAHALKGRLDTYGESIYAKAVLYHMFHCLGILIVGILVLLKDRRDLNIAGWLFLAGIFLFSGSLYVLAITGIRWLGMITPFGGISFITGWLILAWKAKSN